MKSNIYESIQRTVAILFVRQVSLEFRPVLNQFTLTYPSQLRAEVSQVTGKWLKWLLTVEVYHVQDLWVPKQVSN